MKINEREVMLCDEGDQIMLYVGDYIVAYITKSRKAMTVSSYWCDYVGIRLVIGDYFSDTVFYKLTRLLHLLCNKLFRRKKND